MTKIKKLRELVKLTEKEVGIFVSVKVQIYKLIDEIEAEQSKLFGVSCTFKEKIEKDIERLKKEKVEFKKNWITIDGEVEDLYYFLTTTNTQIKALKTALNYC